MFILMVQFKLSQHDTHIKIKHDGYFLSPGIEHKVYILKKHDPRSCTRILQHCEVILFVTTLLLILLLCVVTANIRHVIQQCSRIKDLLLDAFYYEFFDGYLRAFAHLYFGY